MAGGTPTLYTSAVQEFHNGTQDWDTDSHYAVLVTSSYSPLASHSTYADVSATQITAAGKIDMGGEAVNNVGGNVQLTANGVNFNVGTYTAKYIVILQGTAAGSSSTDRLVGYGELNVGGTLSTSSTNLYVSWSGGVVFDNAPAAVLDGLLVELDGFIWAMSEKLIVGTDQNYPVSAHTWSDTDDVKRVVDASKNHWDPIGSGAAPPYRDTGGPSANDVYIGFNGSSENFEWDGSVGLFNAPHLGTEFTIGVEFFYDTNACVILANRSSSNQGFDLVVRGDDKFGFSTKNAVGTTLVALASTTVLSTGTWYKGAIVCNAAGEYHLYLDDFSTPEASDLSPSVGAGNSADDIYWGRYAPGSTSYYDGGMRRLFFVRDTALTQSQIEALFTFDPDA